jgi:ABC-2 type transport system ATP-binding protein
VVVAIEMENLQKTFGGKVKALDGVTLSVESGTVFGLLGPNGAGKTTAVRILTTVLSADGGSARVLGHDVGLEPDAVRRRIGLAGQFAAVDENLTGAENLWLAGRLNRLSRKEVKARTSQLLEQFGLADAANRTSKTYSGGMRRRLDVAASLVAQPEVLFLDEPTTGLDPASRADLWEMIERLVAQGTTVLLTTQYLEEADRLAERLAVVDHGKVIAEGTPTSLKSQMGATVLEVGFADPKTASFAAQLLDGVGGQPPAVEDSKVEVNVNDGPRVVTQALGILEAQGITPATLALREPSLDDVFLALTGKRTESDDGHAPANREGRIG